MINIEPSSEFHNRPTPILFAFPAARNANVENVDKRAALRCGVNCHLSNNAKNSDLDHRITERERERETDNLGHCLDLTAFF